MYEWKDGELVTAAKLNDYSAGMEKFKEDAETAKDEAEAAKAVAEEKAAAAEQSAATADAAKTAAENAKMTAQQSADTAAAAKEAAEAAKADAEAAKTAAENAKMTAQQSANTAAADKDAAEAAKADAEAAKTAAAQSEQNAASAKTAAENSAASAASDAQRAEDAVTHNPTIQNGIWYVWDPDQGKYVSTGVAATGQMTVEVTYQQGDSATTPPTGMWLDTPPEVAQGKYLWTKELFSDGTMGYSVARQGIDGTGAVVSVNGKSGEVTLTANDVGAATSEQGKKADNAVQFTSQTLTAAQKDQARTNIGAGTEDFIITITTTDGNNFTCDRTSAEINEAYAAGKNLVCTTTHVDEVRRLNLVGFSAPASAYGFSIVLNETKNSGATIMSFVLICSTSNVIITREIGYALTYGATNLTDAYKNQFRSNIGAGTSNFSGNFTDLSDIPEGVEVMLAEFESTTFEELQEAFDEHKQVYCYYTTSDNLLASVPNCCYRLVTIDETRGAIFMCFQDYSTLWVDMLLCDASSTWSRYFACLMPAPMQDGSTDGHIMIVDGSTWIATEPPFADKPTTLTSTLSAGSTTLTLSNTAITTSSTIDIYTDKWGVNPTDVAVESGKITLTFDKQSAALGVKVEVR